MPSEQPTKPSGRLWRRTAIAAGIALVLVVATLASTLLFREDLAEVALRDQLKAFGLENARFRVEQFTTNEFVVTSFSAESAVSFDRLAVVYSAGDVLRGRLARVELSGLNLDLTQPRRWAVAGGKGSGGAGFALEPSDLPVIEIREARLRLPGPGGPVSVAASASMLPDRDGNLALRVKATTTGPPGSVAAAFEGTVRPGSNGGATAAGRLTASAESLTAENATFNSPRIVMPLSAEVAADGAASVSIKDASFRTAGLNVAPNVAAGPITLSLTGSFTARSADEWLDGTADISFDTGSIRADKVAAERGSVTLPLRMKVAPGTAELAIAREAKISLVGIRAADAGPVAVFSCRLAGRATLSWTSGDARSIPTVAHDLSIMLDPLTLPGPPAVQSGPSKIETSGNLTPDGAYRGRVTIDAGSVTRGGQSVAFNGVEARLSAKAGFAEPGARITVEAIRDLSAATVAGAPIGGTYHLSTDIGQSGDRLVFQAVVGGLGHKQLVTMAGSHDPVRRAGRADVSLPAVAFGSAGIEPAAVIPSLRTIRKVSGKVEGSAKLTWSDGELDGQARLRLDGVGGETDNVAVKNLSGAIVLNRLMPPSTAPEQVLRVSRIEAGAVLQDMVARFTLLPSGSLRIDHAEADLAGGKIILSAPDIDPAAETAQATLTLQGVDLKQLLDLANLGDVRATGAIHGFVPIRITGGKVAIDAGALASLGGGNLQFKSERARQILQSGGEQVALMLQALEDFTYERLGVDIEKDLAGNARVTLRTLGHNPAVLGGRKFQINVNLDTNIDRLLQAALEWYRLSGRAWRDIVAHGKRNRTSKK